MNKKIEQLCKEINRRMFPNGREAYVEEFERKIEEML